MGKHLQRNSEVNMCGITGFCDFTKRSTKSELIKMTERLNHRGPDDSGYSLYEESDYNLGLGHTRLSILDLSRHGHQPMCYKELEVVYNGEVYNFEEIRTELKKHGYTFDSDSDTEVLIKAYYEWGVKAVDKFNGMFSITIYDKRINKLVLIRDRSGVKPLYYYNKNNLFMFSSELKSFHENQFFQKNINLDSVALFLQMGYILEPHTIFDSTYKLKAGHYLEVDLATKEVKEIKYWDVIDFYNMPKFDISEAEAVTETEKLLKSAFNYRMVSDVPVGVFLSGGYDSSIVTSLIQSEQSEKLKTFTIGFNEESYNEAPHAKNVANHLGTDHTEYYCTEKEAISIVPTIAEIYDEPFGDSSAIPTILVSQMAKKDVSVSLSADGGDEIFAGYSKYVTNVDETAKKINLIKRFLGKSTLNKFAKILQETGVIKDAFFENKVSKFAYENSPELQKLTSYYTTPYSIEKLLGKHNKIITNFDAMKYINADMHSLDKMLAVDYKTYMVDDILHKVDRATMSVSLEGREPLLDYRIIEFISRLPVDLKIKNGDKKWLLKEITHKYLPKDIMNRPKMGFGIPVDEWLKNELKDYVEEYFSMESILDKGELLRIKNLFFQGKVNFRMVWNLLMFQMWYKKWM
jgi:asparagine synthase (glutamine-hydrolysing)